MHHRRNNAKAKDENENEKNESKENRIRRRKQKKKKNVSQKSCVHLWFRDIYFSVIIIKILCKSNEEK